jgi:hypothetical protein
MKEIKLYSLEEIKALCDGYNEMKDTDYSHEEFTKNNFYIIDALKNKKHKYIE